MRLFAVAPLFDLVASLLLTIVLCGGALFGRTLHRALPDHHRTHDTFDFVRVASGLIVTFTALVLSLLLTNVNADFNRADRDLHTYASMIILLDRELADVGDATQPARALLRRYTAAAIASTWPDEVRPGGTYPEADSHGVDIDSAALGDMLHREEVEIRRVAPANGDAEKAQAACLARVSALLDERWSLIGEAHSSIAPLYFALMVLWLIAVFFSFGLTAPRHRTASACRAFVAVAVAGAVFLILELDGPLDGLIKIHSEPLRHALRHLDHVPDGPA